MTRKKGSRGLDGKRERDLREGERLGIFKIFPASLTWKIWHIHQYWWRCQNYNSHCNVDVGLCMQKQYA
jgi:hypothetical protein